MFYRSSRRTRALVASALGFFLLGSNYCLLGVAADWLGAGPPPACHAEVAQRPAHGCCTGKSERTPESAPQQSGPVHGYPCCMLLAQAGSPVLAKSAVTDAPVAYAPIEFVSTLSADLGTRSQVLERAGPNSLNDARLPRASRAPPLS